MYNCFMKPRFPTHAPVFAKVCLDALVQQGLGDKLSISGAFGLLHFIDYRPTNDVDAWWMESVTTEDQRRIISALEEALKPYGQIRTRKWGEVVSVELVKDKKNI